VAGVDLNGDIRLNQDFGLRGGFTFQRARWDDPEEQFGTQNFFRTPTKYGFFGFDWDAPSALEIAGTFDYTGTVEVPHYAGYISEDRLEYTTDFPVFNLVASRVFEVRDSTRVRLYLNVQNIAGEYQPDLDRGPSRDSAYVYGPSETQRVVVGMTVDF